MNTTTLSERIRHARELKGLSREELSEQLGVSAMTIRRWKNTIGVHVWKKFKS